MHYVSAAYLDKDCIKNLPQCVTILPPADLNSETCPAMQDLFGGKWDPNTGGKGGDEGKGDEGKGDEGKDDEGKDDEGKDDEGKDGEGKDGKEMGGEAKDGEGKDGGGVGGEEKDPPKNVGHENDPSRGGGINVVPANDKKDDGKGKKADDDDDDDDQCDDDDEEEEDKPVTA